jgi:hypothetical protein
MAEGKIGSRIGSLLIGGVVGWLAAAAASRARGGRGGGMQMPGLSAFEQAPCFKETVQDGQESGTRDR